MKTLLQIRKKYLFYLLPAFLLFSCGSRDVYNAYINVDKQGWDADSISKFSFNIQDTAARYNSYINIRHAGDFPYRNLCLFVDLISPDSSIIRDTTTLTLAGESGKWVGVGSSSVRHLRYLYKQNIRFPLPGKYEYSLAHVMTDSVLRGVVNVGIRIEYSK